MKTPYDIPYWKKIYDKLPLHEKALAWADSQNGVTEIGNTNTGVEVNEYQRVAGMGSDGGFFWCACFVYWCMIKAGYKGILLPNKGKCAAVRNWKSWGKRKGIRESNPQRGDLFYWTNSSGAGHIGFVLSKPVLGVFRTIEGNTSEEGSRNGTKVAKRFRTVSSIKKNYEWGFLRLEDLE